MTTSTKTSVWSIIKKLGAISAGLVGLVTMFWFIINPQIASQVSGTLEKQYQVEAAERKLIAKELADHEVISKKSETRNDLDHLEIKQNQKDVEQRVEKRLDRLEQKSDKILEILSEKR